MPLILTIGAKERESGTLSIRTLDGAVKYGVARDAFLASPQVTERFLGFLREAQRAGRR